MLLVISLPILLLGLAVNVPFAFAIVRDASECRKKSELVFVGPTIWFLATILGGPFTAAVYWLLNHSTLNPRVKEQNPASKPARSTLEHLYEEGALRYGNAVDDADVEKFLQA